MSSIYDIIYNYINRILHVIKIYFMNDKYILALLSILTKQII